MITSYQIFLFLIIGLFLFASGSTGGDSGKRLYEPLTSADTGAVVVNFTGDCIFAGHFEVHVGTSFPSVFRDIPWFAKADINVINLEHPITDGGEKQEKEFIFSMHPDYLPLFQIAGIDLVNAANNHIYDFGATGIKNTMKYLDSVNVGYIGIGANLQEAREPVIFTVKGKRLGFLGYYSGRPGEAATDTSAGISPRYMPYITRDIQKLRPEVDFVIVSYHWGVENERYPEPWQKEFARATVDAGADLIVGHHSHVLQGIEIYKDGVIAYSLGNFIFGGHRRPVHDTLVLQVLFGEQMSVRPIPVRIDRWRAVTPDDSSALAVLDSLRFYSREFSTSLFEGYGE